MAYIRHTTVKGEEGIVNGGKIIKAHERTNTNNQEKGESSLGWGECEGHSLYHHQPLLKRLSVVSTLAQVENV